MSSEEEEEEVLADREEEVGWIGGEGVLKGKKEWSDEERRTNER